MNPKEDADRSHDESLAVYVISVAAQLAGVHPQTLRIYEQKGLLHPSRTSGNTRRYSDSDVDRLRRILDLTQGKGVNLAGARLILDLEDELSFLADKLGRTVELLRATREEMSESISASGAIVPTTAAIDLNQLIDEMLRRLRRPIPIPPRDT